MSLDFITFLVIAIGIAAVTGFTYYFAQRRKQLQEKGPLVYKSPNKTNYNINAMDDDSKLDDLSKAEAEEILRKRDNFGNGNDETLARDDFAKIKRAMDE